MWQLDPNHLVLHVAGLIFPSLLQWTLGSDAMFLFLFLWEQRRERTRGEGKNNCGKGEENGEGGEKGIWGKKRQPLNIIDKSTKIIKKTYRQIFGSDAPTHLALCCAKTGHKVFSKAFSLGTACSLEKAPKGPFQDYMPFQG